MRSTRKHWIVVVALSLVVLLLLFGPRNSKPYELTVSFIGWTNAPLAPATQLADMGARCALLGVTNNDSLELRFHAVAVEYESGTGWNRIIPKEWPWFQGLAWASGSGSMISIPRPAEVPSSSRWRIQFLCFVDGQTDVGSGARNNARTKLNQLARKLLRRDTLLFYMPKKMVTPEIPPAEPNHSAGGNAGTAHRFAFESHWPGVPQPEC